MLPYQYMDLKLLQIRRAFDRLIFIMGVLHLDRRCSYWEGAHCEWYPPCRGYIYHIYIHDDVKKNTYTGCNLGRLLHSLSLVVVGRDVRRMGQSIKLTGVLCFRDLKIDWKKPNLKWILGTLQCGVGSPDRPGEFYSLHFRENEGPSCILLHHLQSSVCLLMF